MDKQITRTTSDFPALPGKGGSERAVGIEVELGGLAPERVARVTQRIVGGHALRQGPGRWRLEQSDLGDLEIYLDTALQPKVDTPLARVGITVGQRIVPVELVTPPLAQSKLGVVDKVIRALERAGAEGSRESLFYGFGLHLNIELADATHGIDIGAIVQTFAALEPWLRTRDPLDVSRRILPFTQPFPRAFVAPVCATKDGSPDTMFELVDRHITSRNHGLDLLPAYKSLAPRRFAARDDGDGAVSARPAYHYRMPEARLGDPNWSLAYEWRRWHLIEKVARDAERRQALCGLWVHGGRLSPTEYHDAVSDILGPLAELAPRMCARGTVVEPVDA